MVQSVTRRGLHATTLRSGKGVVNDTFSYHRLKHDRNLRNLRPIELTGCKSSIDHLVSVPFVPIDPNAAVSVARNNALVFKGQFTGPRPIHFCFEPPTETETLPRKPTVPRYEVLAEGH